jgi:uncharacterized protein YpuA (DUF1002 family)
MMKKLLTLTLALLLAVSCMPMALADSVTPRGYLVLGEDLNEEQADKVLEFLKVDNLSDYSVSYTTNKEEHAAFDDYLGPEVVGSKALSSILLTPREKGAGITVSSYNITYCTVEMYQNALISAGVKDVDVAIAAPVPVSGTCALVSAMNAYSTLTGKKLDSEAADVAAAELVTTGEVADVIGDKDAAAQLIAALKQKMVEEDMDEDQLSVAVDQVSDQLGVALDQKRKEQVIELLLRIKNTDIDVDQLASQAGDLYKKVSGLVEGMNIQPRQAAGFLEKLMDIVFGLLKSFKG